jgi:DNA-binding LytR/AlgR family response regulator
MATAVMATAVVGAATRAPGLRCLVVDDQPETQDQLGRMLRAHPYVARVSTASDATGALRVLRDGDVDAAFIEAQLPGMDGVELAWVLRRLRSVPAVVFVTRSQRRAAEAFDVGAVDYLGKPPHPERLAESLRRVVTVHRTAAVPAPPTGPGAPEPGAAPAAPAPADTADEAIPVELGGTTKIVQRSSVRWARAWGDYVRLHTDEGTHLIRARLANLADCWRGVGFVRIHRSYLVQLRFVSDVRAAESGQLTAYVDGHPLPVSRRMAPNLRSRTVNANGRRGAMAVVTGSC